MGSLPDYSQHVSMRVRMNARARSGHGKNPYSKNRRFFVEPMVFFLREPGKSFKVVIAYRQRQAGIGNICHKTGPF
jgi:hypothetical protein